MTSIVDYLIRVIQYECNHLDAHYQHADLLRSHFLDDDDIYSICIATLPPDRPLPTLIQRDLYVAKPPSHLFTYEADQLFDAFYTPHRNNHFLPNLPSNIPLQHSVRQQHDNTISCDIFDRNTTYSFITKYGYQSHPTSYSYPKHTTLKRF